ncbi:hypothetical protein Tco_1552261, partial [Tanacetum coccineum]
MIIVYSWGVFGSNRRETQWSRDDGNVLAIKERLKSLVTNDPTVIDRSLKDYSDLDCLDNNSILKRMETVDKCFSHDTVEEIIDVLVKLGTFALT